MIGGMLVSVPVIGFTHRHPGSEYIQLGLGTPLLGRRGRCRLSRSLAFQLTRLHATALLGRLFEVRSFDKRMTLASGSLLGPYKILAPLGEGGRPAALR